ncbi:hypothetical protein [Fodinicurvata sediminis]|uniref:hypothetical protein n=1 Tax=Fodinicurvata sediminis TaxID=1121832 RepID=UPI0003B38159|nr:hypothetical protein [Fodinicurvata sediminis]
MAEPLSPYGHDRRRETPPLRLEVDLADYRRQLQALRRETEAELGKALQGRAGEATPAGLTNPKALAELRQGLQQSRAAAAGLNAAADDLGLAFRRAFQGAVQEGGSLSEVLRGLVSDLQRMTLRRVLDGPMEQLGQGLTNQLGGFLGNLLPFGGTPFGGTRATGGPVRPGRAYLVGERGPEIFRPDSGGRILPNGSRQEAAAAPQIIINIQGPGGDPRRVRQAASQAAVQLARIVEKGRRDA